MTDRQKKSIDTGTNKLRLMKKDLKMTIKNVIDEKRSLKRFQNLVDELQTQPFE